METMPERQVSPDQISPRASRSELAGTMIGLPAMSFAEPVAPDVRASSDIPSAQPEAELPPRTRPLNQTLVGFATPAPTPVHKFGDTGLSPQTTVPEMPSPVRGVLSGTLVGHPSPLPAPPEGEPNEPALFPSGSLRAGTLLGVARPGIAPTHRPSSESDPAPRITDARITDPPLAASHSMPPSSRRAAKTQTLFGGFVVALALAGSLGAAFAWFTRPHHSVQVIRFETNAELGDFIVVEGAKLPPRTRLRIGREEVELTPGGARIALGHKLKVGQNEVPIQLITPGNSPIQEDLLVPVAFRVDTAFQGLDTEKPLAVVTVTAPRGAQVTLQGANVPLKEGSASLTVDLGPVASGFEAKSLRVEREISVKVKDGDVEKATTARVAASQTPLQLTLPPAGHVLASGPLVVEGRTAPGALVTVGTSPIIADPSGLFRTLLDAPQSGELAIRSSTPTQIARGAKLALSTPAEWTAPTRSVATALGQLSTFEGRVVEARAKNGVTHLIVQLAPPCPESRCLATVSFAQSVDFARDTPVLVSGIVQNLSPYSILAQRVTARNPTSH